MPDDPMTLDSIVVRSSAPVSADLGDEETALMHIDQGHYYGLNAVASDIWALLETPRRVSDLLDNLLEAYEVTPETCRSELLAYLDKLAEYDLLSVVDASAD